MTLACWPRSWKAFWGGCSLPQDQTLLPDRGSSSGKKPPRAVVLFSRAPADDSNVLKVIRAVWHVLSDDLQITVSEIILLVVSSAGWVLCLVVLSLLVGRQFR
jgi:hypothetical protein